jgi:enoyl-CoA hydratase
MSSYKFIQTEIHDRVGLVQINRPEALNALNSILIGELMDALVAFDNDPVIGAMVITGDKRAFAAGADIKEMADAGAVEMFQRDNISRFDRIMEIKKPVIAVVSGWCLGGGNELAMSCDMIVASETARFGQPEINLGVIPGAGGTQRLAKAVGKAIAMEMVLNNRTLTATEALSLGLINRIATLDSYLEEGINLANEIASRAPLALRLGKEAVNNAFETSLTKGLAEERRAFYFLFGTSDQKEGMAAFIEKRQPEWKGE